MQGMTWDIAFGVYGHRLGLRLRLSQQQYGGGSYSMSASLFLLYAVLATASWASDGWVNDAALWTVNRRPWQLVPLRIYSPATTACCLWFKHVFRKDSVRFRSAIWFYCLKYWNLFLNSQHGLFAREFQTWNFLTESPCNRSLSTDNFFCRLKTFLLSN